MSTVNEVRQRVEARGHSHQSGAAQRAVVDERLETVLHDMTVDQLRRLQGTLYELLGDGLLSTDQFASTDIAETLEGQSKDVADWLRDRQTRDDAIKIVMLLGALAVAIAWLTYRNRPAPAQNILQVIHSVDEGHPYLLPIPRSDPCFCGSTTKFKNCHGRPPNAAPSW